MENSLQHAKTPFIVRLPAASATHEGGQHEPCHLNSNFVTGTKTPGRSGVAAEYEGFQDSKAESTDIYDAHREWGTLKPLKEVKDTIENHNQEGFFSEAHNQMREIDTALDDYVDKLARNAELGNVDTTKVKGPTFDRLARIFENANKDKLVVKKWPSAWL